MKYFLLIFALFFIVACKSKVVETPQQNIKEQSNLLISKNKNADFTTSSELEQIVNYLASDELRGRKTGTDGIEKAAIFIENKFKSYNLKPYFENFRDTYKAGDIDAYNIVGFIEGNDIKLKNEVIIIGAHYDHIGQGQLIKMYGGRLTEIDSIANGANDNASGTSSVLALARYFGEKKSNKRSLMFALYSGEEFGLLGSKHLASKLKAEELNLYTMVNFEMIGVPLNGRDFMAFLSGYDLSNMAFKFNEYVDSNLIGLSDLAKKYNLFRKSDNYPFYEQFNLPCQTVSSCDLSNYEYYHHVDDESDQLDYEFMASLINKLIPAIEKMSKTQTKEIKMNE